MRADRARRRSRQTGGAGEAWRPRSSRRNTRPGQRQEEHEAQGARRSRRCRRRSSACRSRSPRSDTEIRDIYANFRERYSRDLLGVRGRASPSSRARPATCDRAWRSCARSMRKLGQVNLMAPEEFARGQGAASSSCPASWTTCEARAEDLSKVTAEIRTESAELFLETYNKVKKNFHAMFRRLFGGGRAELQLTDPENVPGVGHRDPRAAAGQEAREHQPAVGRREDR
ncbi:MAG: hypothetical protein MZU91_14420 [Desulfosudis oleivorans]|nr:hypothetical protein [Desulfosudis oleivorans]